MRTIAKSAVLALCVAALPAAIAWHPEPTTYQQWNPKAAASYLDYRASWWMGWPKSARDHQTFCISCHTALPYALARPALHTSLGETADSPNEHALIANVIKRVRLWKEVEPYYDLSRGPYKPAESRGTEAVLNALILCSHDAASGKLSDDARLAFDNMWALQVTDGAGKGAWPWIQFDNEPWEAPDSQYYGAALAALALGNAPENYRSSAEIHNRLDLLRDYLNREFDKQTTVNHAVVLWASAKWPGLIAPERRDSITRELISKQQADGGWSLSSMVGDWKRHDNTPLEKASDGYATGLAVLALEQGGVTRNNSHLKDGRAWLLHSQNATEGLWPGYSLNKQHDLSTETGHFMSDAATAYAVLALTQSGR